MKKWHIAAIVAAGLTAGLALAQDAARNAGRQPAGKELKTVREKVSYGFGLNIARNLQQEELDLDADLLMEGFRDGIAGRDARISDEDLQAAVATFQKEMALQEAEDRVAADPELKAQSDKNKKEGREFLAANARKQGVTTLPSGLQYSVVKQGRGRSPAATDLVRVHYHGTLIDGTVFDSSVDRGEPAEFPVNRVIEGWVEALQKMKVGDKWKLVVPTELAYGASVHPAGKIGPHAVLVFEVELLEIVSEDEGR